MNHIARWHILISGFLQATGEPTGLQRLWLRLGRLRDPSTCVLLQPWDADVANLAELIWLCRPAEKSPAVKIYGYSWGGSTAVRLARQLKKRGIAIRWMVLCDAVHRPRWWPLRWMALLPWMRIRIPDNVEEVWWCRQYENLPRGHGVVADDPGKTAVAGPLVATNEHSYMDELREFQEAAELIARCA